MGAAGERMVASAGTNQKKQRMKNFWISIQPAVTITFWLLCTGGVVVLLTAALVKKHDHVFEKIQVTVDESHGHLFVSEEDILQMLTDHQVTAGRTEAAGNINYARLEEVIENNPFVSSAEVFIDAHHTIRVEVAQRLPVLRIINNQRVSYYLDEHGKRMPCSAKFTARVPVATGFNFTNAVQQTEKDSLIEHKLFTLTQAIRRDSFMNALTEQIVVTEQEELQIIPLAGDHVILLGDENGLEEKFRKLKVFYRQGLNHTGWNRYHQINLKYRDEVVAVKKDHRALMADTLEKGNTPVTAH
jgi:cell division protein FtsQ